MESIEIGAILNEDRLLLAALTAELGFVLHEK